jgi:signal transduction histidine kinase
MSADRWNKTLVFSLITTGFFLCAVVVSVSYYHHRHYIHEVQNSVMRGWTAAWSSLLQSEWNRMLLVYEHLKRLEVTGCSSDGLEPAIMDLMTDSNMLLADSEQVTRRWTLIDEHLVPIDPKTKEYKDEDSSYPNCPILKQARDEGQFCFGVSLDAEGIPVLRAVGPLDVADPRLYLLLETEISPLLEAHWHRSGLFHGWILGKPESGSEAVAGIIIPICPSEPSASGIEGLTRRLKSKTLASWEDPQTLFVGWRWFMIDPVVVYESAAQGEVRLLLIQDTTGWMVRFFSGIALRLGFVGFGLFVVGWWLHRRSSMIIRELTDLKDSFTSQKRENERILSELRLRESMFRKLFQGAPIPMIQVDFHGETQRQMTNAWQAIHQESSLRSTLPVSSMPELLTLLKQGWIEGINDAAIDLFVLAGPRAQGGSLGWLVDAMDDRLLTMLLKLAVKKRSFSNIECQLLPSHGARITALVDLALLKQEDDQELILFTFRDVTEQRREHQAVLLAKEEAEEANRIKTHFMANVSHELKTPLNAIIGFSDLLTEAVQDEAHQEQLKLIRLSGKQLLGIIKDILELTKLETGQGYLSFSLFGLRELMGDIIRSFHPLLESKPLKINHEHVGSDEGWFCSDLGKLHHLLNNLMHNAIKFTEAGTITIVTRSETLGSISSARFFELSEPLKREISRVVHEEFENSEEAILSQLHISIIDTGVGIPESRIKQIFEPFSQGDLSPTRRYGGTGLGLTVCQKLVQSLDGRIACSNCVGGGSQFQFSVHGVTSSTGRY